jgi:inorganic triphosphatase YgiF
MQSEHPIPLECEATLLICSDRPETVYQEIASLTAIGEYKLIPGEPQLLQDHYFDTPDGKLMAKKWGLRLRWIGPNLWITLKGPSKQTEWGGRERTEIEALWSKTSVAEVEAELSRQGIEMDFHGEDLEHSDPMEVMTSAGFVVIQRRDTKRAASAVITGTDGMVQAELAADSVAYFFPQMKILHYEVEIEIKGPHGPTAAVAIAEYLLAEYSPELKRWRHDKLATGWAIKELLAGGSLEGLLDVNNRLKSGAYDKIDEYLRHELS